MTSIPPTAHSLSHDASHLPGHNSCSVAACSVSESVILYVMQPLQCPELFKIDENKTEAEKFWSKIPFLGWGISGHLWDKRVEPIVEKVEQQLKARPKPPPSLWGTDEKKVALAQFICAKAGVHMGWPNDHFIPDDPMVVVFWVHQDALDVEFAIFAIEDEYDIKLKKEEINVWFKGNLGQMIDAIYTKESN